MAGPSLPPAAVWEAAVGGDLRILDLRTRAERRLLGRPPGAEKVSLVRHLLRPEGPGTVYLCQHAVRSGPARRRGAAEVAGGFRAWRKAGLPTGR